MARKLIVEIIGDADQLERTYARATKSTNRFGRQLRSLAASFGVVFGTAGAVRGITSAIDAASDLNEEINKTSVIFGKAGASIISWAGTTANSLGLSQKAALEGAGAFGGMFKALNVAGKQSAQMSKTLTILAADMASMNNQDPSEMLLRLRSGLAGEAEPLRRFSVFIDEASTKQEAYRVGIAKQGSQLTQAQKVLARYSLIMRQTGFQQGDFARTSEGWANVQRRLNALVENFAARLGSSLLPMLAEYGDRLADWLAKSDNQERLIRDISNAVRAMAGIVRAAIKAWNLLNDAVDAITLTILKVQLQAQKMALTIKGTAIEAALSLVEPFSRIPWKGGEWARDAKKALREMADETAAEANRVGALIGDNYGQGITKGAKKAVAKAGATKTVIPGAGAGAGGAGAGGGGRARRGVTAAQRNTWWDAMIGRFEERVQDIPNLRGQLAAYQKIAAMIRERISQTGDLTRRLNLEDQLLANLRNQKAVQQQITDQIKAGNQALKDRADAIKSAVIERLQRRQTAILNQRALTDALEQLRIARQIGGPKGIQAAQRTVADVKFDMLVAKLEAAPATLTRGGQFAMGGGITININGVTDPDAVARKVTEVLEKRGRRTTTQTRGAAAGSHAGQR